MLVDRWMQYGARLTPGFTRRKPFLLCGRFYLFVFQPLNLVNIILNDSTLVGFYEMRTLIGRGLMVLILSGCTWYRPGRATTGRGRYKLRWSFKYPAAFYCHLCMTINGVQFTRYFVMNDR